MSNMPEEVSCPKQKPTVRLTMPKAKAQDLTIDQPATFKVSGLVKSLQPCYSDEDLYEVEMQDIKVEKEDSSGEEPKEEKKDDENMATMPREKLKESIKKASDEE